ncbi:MAG TPA: endonuclease/exonuclease/phosphatase family protein [Ktedonosporobacter sp.]|nr:endonuclease/exonuclease/phosphatase family protein [Ktedonosporobacter sp.]
MALRIFSYNILEGGGDRLPLIASLIQQQQPDVVALLEARSVSNVEALAQQLGMHVAVGMASNTLKDHVAWLSRFPIVRTENHPLILSKTLLEIEIYWQGAPLTLFATHLKAAQDRENEQRRVAEMQAILRFLRTHPNQLHALVGDLNTVHPGDQVNAAEWIAVLKERGKKNPAPQFPRQVIPLLLEADYVDCYRTIHPAASGYTTHTGHPALRIDYIFASPPFAQHLFACDIVTGEEAEKASDHFPVWAEFR